jgi:6-phosphogluconolactonase
MVTPDNKQVVVSNRGHNSLALFDRNAIDGKLKLNAHYPTGGDHPRNFDISKDAKIITVANQDSDRINAFIRNPVTGTLRTSATTLTATPAYIKLFDLADYPWGKP